MKSFTQYVHLRELAVDNFDKSVSPDTSDEHLDALERAIRLAYERRPSQVKEFFRSLGDKEIEEIASELERSSSHDKAAQLFTKKRRDPEEVVPPAADSGFGDGENGEWTSNNG